MFKCHVWIQNSLLLHENIFTGSYIRTQCAYPDEIKSHEVLFPEVHVYTNAPLATLNISMT
jgi:hypothetical protein